MPHRSGRTVDHHPDVLPRVSVESCNEIDIVIGATEGAGPARVKVRISHRTRRRSQVPDQLAVEERELRVHRSLRSSRTSRSSDLQRYALGEHNGEDLIRQAMLEEMGRDRLCDLALEGLAIDLFVRVGPNAHQMVFGDAPYALVVLGDLRGHRRPLVRDDENLIHSQASCRNRREEYCRHDQR